MTISDHISGKGRVVAVLGPTNTGKTHLAIERLMGHSSGIIGFPLRLLAREVYDKLCRLRPAGDVALITGEEKIIPKGARFFICTVESMPVDKPVAFLAVDEIQLCTDPDRGHVFTDRLLHARGLHETMFLGSDTMRPLIQRLVPEAEFITRPRLSSLTYAGTKKLTRLPRRSAIVAFSAADVYGIAELVRRQRGGTAVVLGALSPRTRNAQVAMYQAGEVDYLVATDAVGMGLNMDVDHVAFARMVKFDGFAPRALTAMEVGQIAGRAGRHLNDGTFGTTEEVGALDADLIERVENHRYETLKQVMWRNTKLDFRSLDGLLRSLDRRPDVSPALAEILIRRREADDQMALAALAQDESIRTLARAPAAIRLLWDVCQIPDFRKVMSDEHARLLGQIYNHLMRGDGRLPTDWVGRLVDRLDRAEGDIDALVGRIAHVRTWTYIAHRGDWLDDPLHWQERTRAIEDRLSDALHGRLTERFVDRRSAALVRSLASGAALLGHVRADGVVHVEGEPVGRLDGFRFVPESGHLGEDERAVLAAARRALRDEIAARVKALESAADESFAIASDGGIAWRGVPVARLVPGRTPLTPRVVPLDSTLFESGQADRIRERLTLFVGHWVRERLRPLFDLMEAQKAADELTGAGRGLAFQLVEGFGTLRLPDGPQTLAPLTRADRARLAGFGVRIGRRAVWLNALVKPRAVEARALLHAVATSMKGPVPTPGPGRVSVPCHAEAGFYLACGYLPIGRLAVRIDVLEKLADDLGGLSRQGAFAAPDDLASKLGGNAGDVDELLRWLEFKPRVVEGQPTLWRRRRRPVVAGRLPVARLPNPAPTVSEPPTPRRGWDESPFAVLRQLVAVGGVS